jgi:hypothetical protein
MQDGGDDDGVCEPDEGEHLEKAEEGIVSVLCLKNP